MRRVLLFIATGALALAGSAFAIADTTGGSISTTTATFTAAKSDATARTCKGADGDYVITRGTYTGKIMFADPNGGLSGDVTIRARSIQKSGGTGYLDGTFRLGNGNDHQGIGRVVGTFDVGGNLDGFVQAVVGAPRVMLGGHVGGTFKPDTGFDGTIGKGGSQLPAVVITHPCSDAKMDEHQQGTPDSNSPKPGRPTGIVFLRGKVTAAATGVPGSITVDDKAPCVTNDKSPSLSDVKTGTEVWAVCGQVDGKLTLLKLWKLPPHPTPVATPA